MPVAANPRSVLGMSRPQMGRRLTKAEAQKFLLNTVAPALIQPEEANRLIDFVVNESLLFNEATVERMTTNEKDIRFIDISSSVLRQAVCGATPTESVTISNTNKCLRTVSLDALFYMCDDDLEDGLTGAQLQTQVLRMASDQISNELELWSLMANANNIYTTGANSPTQVNAAVLHLRDGWYRQLQQGHIIDAGAVGAGQSGTQRALDEEKLICLKTAIPTKYRKNPAGIRIYMPTDMHERDYTRLLQVRATDLGDSTYVGATPERFGLSPIVPVPMIPTDVQECGCGSLDSPNGTFMFYTDPANLILGMERNITFERERVAREHRTWFIWTIRVDVMVFNEDASSLMDCMQLTACGPGVCAPGLLINRCNACLDQGSGGEP